MDECKNYEYSSAKLLFLKYSILFSKKKNPQDKKYTTLYYSTRAPSYQKKPLTCTKQSNHHHNYYYYCSCMSSWSLYPSLLFESLES